MRRSLGATVLLAAALSGAVIAVDDADELLSKSQAITAVKTKGEVIAILCTVSESLRSIDIRIQYGAG
jgi:hypothetical protein